MFADLSLECWALKDVIEKWVYERGIRGQGHLKTLLTLRCINQRGAGHLKEKWFTARLTIIRSSSRASNGDIEPLLTLILDSTIYSRI